MDFIIPDWPAPSNVKSLQTVRTGGVSAAPYDSLNFGTHVKDNPINVARNMQLLSHYLPSEPVWLNQTHGVQVVDAATASCTPDADASCANKKHVVCATMTADCLPILLCDTAGTVVAAVHAGWRGLCDGVIEATITKMISSYEIQSTNLMAWLGPGIGRNAFEVGEDVRQQFITKDAQAESAFSYNGNKWHGDLYQIARQRLHAQGVAQIYGGSFCTYSDSQRFFSFRRDGDTGRMTTLIWLTSRETS